MLGNGIRRLAATLALALTPVAFAATADAAPVKPTALFGLPGANAIQGAIINNINRTPKGGSIQVNTWSFSDVAVSDALIEAFKRGVHVEVIVAGQSKDYPAVQNLKAWVDGGIPLVPDDPYSTVIISTGPARVSTSLAALHPGQVVGTMHQKSWTFSRVGKTPFVSIVTSANVTDNANAYQYNDGYQFVRDAKPYNALRGMFAQQRLLQGTATPFRVIGVGKGRTMTFTPWNALDMPDPVIQRIQALPKKVTIRAANAGWFGSRGLAIAQALAAKKAAGANVKVLYNAVGGEENPVSAEVAATLRAAKIPAKSVASADRYVHGKFMIAKYGGQTRVWTGSENWADDPRESDELVAMLTGKPAYAQFNRWFNTLWLL